jgi:hypothetical protein
MQIATDARFNRNANVAGLCVLLGLGFAFVPGGLVGASLSRTTALVFVTAITINAVNRRFGPQGVGIRNLVLVYGVTATSVVLMFYRPDAILLERLAFLILSGAFLGVGIRTQNGIASVLTMRAFLRSRVTV